MNTTIEYRNNFINQLMNIGFVPYNDIYDNKRLRRRYNNDVDIIDLSRDEWYTISMVIDGVDGNIYYLKMFGNFTNNLQFDIYDPKNHQTIISYNDIYNDENLLQINMYLNNNYNFIITDDLYRFNVLIYKFDISLIINTANNTNLVQVLETLYK